ncbi:hypothetical protein ABZT17_11005 [Streptomyces sp. NPDC005648]|uniref:hypothetical protein n=1 Tax=Streptomyces sp. NPDC005648 TaxID=3157044 RepID=UPI0033A39AAE
MIEQAYVQADDKTSPAVKDIRERISKAVDATTGTTALERLRCWLQMPVDSEFAKMLDNDCQVRARRVGGLLSSGTGGMYEPADLSVALNVPGKWTAIDSAVKAERAVYVNGSTGHVGGTESKFNNTRNTGFRVIVFLAVGQESGGRGYYLGFDPDVSATKESQTAWTVASGAWTWRRVPCREGSGWWSGWSAGSSTAEEGPVWSGWRRRAGWTRGRRRGC